MNLIRSIYDNILVQGINVIFGRPGTGKSRLLYSIAEEYNNSLLVSKNLNIELKNVYEKVVVHSIKNMKEFIRILDIMKSDVVCIEEMSHLDRNDILNNITKLKSLSRKFNTKFIFSTQVREDIKISGRIYPHMITGKMIKYIDELIYLEKIEELKEHINILVKCKESKIKVVLPIPKNERISDKLIMNRIMPSYPLKTEEVVKEMILYNIQTYKDNDDRIELW